MRKKQLIQTIQFIGVRILTRAFVTFILKESFIDFLLRYWLYFIIVNISYFYYYSIQYEPDKKYELIRNIIFYGNVYLFLHIFFRPILNISHQLFVLLGLIFLGLWRSSKLKSRWKYLLQTLGGIFSFFILISGMFYYYPEAPDINGFINNRMAEIWFLGVDEKIDKNDAYIQLTTTKDTTNLEIVPNFKKALSENQKVSYPSTKIQRDEKIIIITPQGDLLWLFPQSEIQLLFDGKILKKVSKLSGKILFSSGVFNSNIEVLGYEQNLTQEQQEWLEGIHNSYKFELVSYLKNQISESNIGWANNTIMYNIDGKIIGFLAKMFPVTFSKNLHNYNEFQKYFSWTNKPVNLSKYNLEQPKGSNDSFLESMKDGIKNGKNNTYGRFKKPQRK